jgi:pimeloyl-ACP methyl ester carboxylesterase
MVWLPGAFHGADDFLNAGFSEAVQKRRLGLDLTFVDLEIKHLGDRSALEQLRSLHVLPTIRQGASVWLAGISLGGWFALDYAITYPDECAGLLLLAPYLGNRMLAAEITEARGLEAWEPGELAEADEERRIWRYLKTRSAAPPLYLGFGQHDRFAAAHALLAASLPAESVKTIAGGHDWRTWIALWEIFLDSHFA